MKTFVIDNVEYKIVRNPNTNGPMIVRVDGFAIENRKEICRRFLMMHGWQKEDFGSINTHGLEKSVNNILNGDEELPHSEKSASKRQPVEFSYTPGDLKLANELKNKKVDREFSKEMVQKVLDVLAAKDHLFVSEAHLQTEFIIEAAKLYPDFLYYPELVPTIVPKKYNDEYGENGIHFDLIIKTKNDVVLLEFKYLTNAYCETINGMNIAVKSHMAMDMRRYDS